MPAADVTVGAEFTRVVFTTVDSASFGGAFAIQGSEAGLRFTIITGAAMILGPQDLILAAYADKTIVLKGETPVRTLSLGSIGSLFTVGTDVTLEPEDIVLRGRAGNNTFLVWVDGGTLVMNGGEKVRGNDAITSGAGGRIVTGGVLINNAGTVIMR
ncbi:MAG: hypothetical protein LBP74_03985 [Treponema sp.]|jgi:hypothetical protein|nr:hypothetical protein [Treponema sp.]